MGKRSSVDPPNDFESRLNRLEESASLTTSAGTGGKRSGYGMAFAIATDLVGGLIGGAGIGWLIDHWLDSKPLGMVVFFFLGAAAGMWNVYRTVRGYDMSLGFKPAIKPAERPGEVGASAGTRSDNEGGDDRGQSSPSI